MGLQAAYSGAASIGGVQTTIKTQAQARIHHKCVHSVMTGHGHTGCFKMLQFGKVLIAEPFLPCRGFLNVATAHGSETVLQSRQLFSSAVGHQLGAEGAAIP